MGVSALKWQGWLVGLVVLAGLLVFAPLGLYVWASGGDPPTPAPRAAVEDVRVTACRIDPASRRVVASVAASGRREGAGVYGVSGAEGAGGAEGAHGMDGAHGEYGTYLVTVGFRESEQPDPARRAAQALVRIPGVAPGATEYAEAVGPVWPLAAVPWCGVAAAEFTPGR